MNGVQLNKPEPTKANARPNLALACQRMPLSRACAHFADGIQRSSMLLASALRIAAKLACAVPLQCLFFLELPSQRMLRSSPYQHLLWRPNASIAWPALLTQATRSAPLSAAISTYRNLVCSMLCLVF